MKLYSYCIPIDDGAAPNPYWDVCTLVICKPVIRRVAQVDDWVVGVGSNNVNGVNYSGKLVYAMKVTLKLMLQQYDNYCKSQLLDKIPDITNSDYRRKVGDCIYHYSGRKVLQRPGVHAPENIEKDLNGRNALLSRHFYYFGKEAVGLPEKFSLLIRQGPGHQSHKNEPVKEDFIEWLLNNFEKNKLYGDPQIKLRFTKNSLARSESCAEIRCKSAEDDETYSYEDTSLPLSHWNYFLALESDLKTISRYIELHESNYNTFSIGLTQLFLAACSEIDVVLKEICTFFSSKKLGKMKEYSEVILDEIPSILSKSVSVPSYNITLMPFKNWTKKSPPDWWHRYNQVKHKRNKHYTEANLKNTLHALGALHILIFELFRVYKDKKEGEFSTSFIFNDLQPKQELFVLEGEGMWPNYAEGKRIF